MNMQLCDFGPNSDVRVERIHVTEWEIKYACTSHGKTYETADPIAMHRHLMMHVRMHHKVPRTAINQIGSTPGVIK